MKKIITPVALRLVLVATIGLGVMASAPATLAGTGQGGGNCGAAADTTALDFLAGVRVLVDVADLLLP